MSDEGYQSLFGSHLSHQEERERAEIPDRNFGTRFLEIRKSQPLGGKGGVLKSRTGSPQQSCIREEAAYARRLKRLEAADSSHRLPRRGEGTGIHRSYLAVRSFTRRCQDYYHRQSGCATRTRWEEGD